jgi:hypothetical protein
MWIRETRLIFHEVFIYCHKYIWNSILIAVIVCFTEKGAQRLPNNIMGKNLGSRICGEFLRFLKSLTMVIDIFL